MLINNWDISEAGAQQWQITFTPSTFDNDSTWESGSISPVFVASEIGKKTIKIVLMVRGSSREEILDNISDILARLIDPAELYLDNYDGGYYNHTFYGIMTKSSTSEFVQDRSHKLTIEFEALERGGLVTGNASRPKSIVINNQGNIPTPLTLKIVPTIGAASLKIEGCFYEPLSQKDRGCTISTVLTDQEIIIDGENGLITNGGTLADAEFYQLPALQPGSNMISFSTDFINVSYSFYPRFF